MVRRITNFTIAVICCFCITTQSFTQFAWSVSDDETGSFFLNYATLTDEGQTLVFSFGNVSILDPEGNLENSFNLPVDILGDCIYSSYEDGVIEVIQFAGESSTKSIVDLDGNLLSSESIPRADAGCFRSVLKMSENYYLLLDFRNTTIQIYDIREGVILNLNNVQHCDFNENYFVTTQQFNNPPEPILTYWRLEDFDARSEYIIPAADQIWLDDFNIVNVRIYDDQNLAKTDLIQSYDILGNLVSENQREYENDIIETTNGSIIQNFNQVDESCQYGIIIGDGSASFISGDPNELMTVTPLDHRFRLNFRSETKFNNDGSISVNQSGDAIIQLFDRVHRINNICGLQNASDNNEEESEENEESDSEQETEETQAAAFDIYPWLNQALSGSCNNLTFEIYETAAATFVYLPDGRLFADDGTLFCTDSPSLDCRSFYNVGNVSSTLNCAGANQEENMEEDDESDDEDDNDNNEQEETQDDAQINDAISQYEWLTDVDLSGSCEIEEYDLGAFAFIYVITEENGTLYFDDGTFFCQSTATNDCRALYNLSEGQITNTFSCGSSSDEGGDNDEDNNGDEGNDGQNSSDALFADYNWLSSVISPDCNSGTVTEYISGIFTFILIETETSTDLYFQDGTYYCNQTATFNCLEIYGLTEVGRTFSCGDGAQLTESRSFNGSLENVTIYPNPFTNEINISIPTDNATVEIFTADGKYIKQYRQVNQGALSVDLSTFQQNLYYVRITNGDRSITEKVIKI